jgi:hypothetical protein
MKAPTDLPLPIPLRHPGPISSNVTSPKPFLVPATVPLIVAEIRTHLFAETAAKRILVLGPEMSAGKTTAMVQLAVSDLSQSGGLLVVERRKTAREVCKRINQMAKVVPGGQKVAGVHYGWKETECDYFTELRKSGNKLKVLRQQGNAGELCIGCSYVKCRSHLDNKKKVLNGCPVVIITHAKLKYLLQGYGSVGDFCRWSGGVREKMIVDELPPMVDTTQYSYSLEDLERGCDDKSLGSNYTLRTKVYPRMLELALGKATYFEGAEVPVAWPGSSFTEASTLVALYNKGGVTTRVGERGWFTLAVPLKFNFRLIKRVVILDGTAKIDPHYPLLLGERGYGRTVPMAINYKIRMRVWGDQKTKTTFKKTMAAYPGRVDHLIREIRNKHPGQRLLIITTKAMVARIQAMKIPRIDVAHYGALRGRNDLLQYRAVYFTHLHQPPPAVVVATAAAAGYKSSNVNFDRKVGAGGYRGFADLELDVIRVQWIVTGLIQDIYRTAVREGHSVDVYVAIAHPGIFNCLRTYYGDRIEWSLETFDKLDPKQKGKKKGKRLNGHG